ncbi:variable surface protein [Plasmodium gonderi]|uniref:Variable surface protein n=1 Tax=Plasmodium gonderi TaxID=77519 RepID=A0A1Y1JSV9_PLAGO|nr:variable surface protein [Plasmodium gonderi]GAW84237.1 variable surface protein [Plasmodium gonderi]
MGKSIYDVLKKFPECKEKMDTHIKQISQGQGDWAQTICNKDTNEFLKKVLIVHNNKQVSSCLAAMNYLAAVYQRNDESLNDAGCEYLYYWIYNILPKNDGTDINVDVKNVYDALLHIYTKFLRDNQISDVRICKGLEDPVIDIYNPEIKDIYDMYKKIFKKEYNQSDIFKDVVDMINNHNTVIGTLNGEISTSRITTPCPRNIAAPIMITFVVTVIVSIFIFVLLKFSECGLWIRRAIVWKRNHWDNISEERNIYQGPEISNSFLRDSRYNVLYNYP